MGTPQAISMVMMDDPDRTVRCPSGHQYALEVYNPNVALCEDEG